MKGSYGSWLVLVLCFGGTLVAPEAAAAQISGDGFLFHPPVVTVSLHGGFARANAGSEVFADVTELLTLERGDFDGASGGGSLAFRITPRVDLAVDAAYIQRTASSEFRDWTEPVGGEELPIVQSTRFIRVPVTVNAKVYVQPRGRSLGSLAWVPSRYAPYVGIGGGAMWYRFRQTGDFVEIIAEDEGIIFFDEYTSSGWAPAVQALAGLDVSLTPHLVVTGETRYISSKAPLSRDFEGFDKIDLSGLSASVGISLRI